MPERHEPQLSVKRLLEMWRRPHHVDAGQPPRIEKRFISIWHELIYICRRIHYWLYIRTDENAARRYLPKLKRILKRLPENSASIAAAEGFALLHTLTGKAQLSLKYRKREIRKLESLNTEIRGSVQSGRLSKKQAREILAGHGTARIKERKAIVKALRDVVEAKRRQAR